MDTTVRPLALLEALAASTHTTSILGLLRKASLAPNDIAVVGRFVSYLASPVRISYLGRWAPDSWVAEDLAQIGRVAWANPDLLAAIQLVGESHLSTKLLHGRVQNLYLAAMASPRRPTQHAHPDAVFFIERLRLLTIVRALEATIAGIPRELHLEAVCLALRHAVEREYSPNWG